METLSPRIKINNKKVCVATSIHSAFDIRIFQKQCRSLADIGYKVVLIAPHSNGGFVKGVKIVPVSRPKNKLERILVVPIRYFRKCMAERADVYHFHDPELAIVGILLKLMRKRVISDVHEDYAMYLMERTKLPYMVRRFLSKLLNFTEKICALPLDQIICATDKINSKFWNRNRIVIHNYPLMSNELTGKQEKETDSGKMNLVFTGLICRKEGLDVVISALEYLNNENIRLILVGRFSDESFRKRLTSMAGWDYVLYKGILSHADVYKLLKSTDVGLECCTPDANNMNAEPNKVFEYMLAGIPVVCSDLPGLRGVVSKELCGLCVVPGNTRSIAECINYLYENKAERLRMGENGRAAVVDRYNWNLERDKLYRTYDRILNTS